MLKMHTLLSEETYKLIPALSPLGLPALIGKRMPYPFTFYIDNLTKLINNPEDIVESQVEKMLEASKAIVRICQDLCNGLISMNKKEAERNNIPENQIEVRHFPASHRQHSLFSRPLPVLSFRFSFSPTA